MVPGHDTAVPVQAGDDGGARAWAARPKISMTIMRPPQHGHGCEGAFGWLLSAAFSL